MEKLQLKPNVTSRPTNLNLIMLFDKEKGVMYELNETASSIISTLTSTPKNIEEIIEIIGKDYNDDKNQIAEDIKEFIADFITTGLLEKI